MQRAGQEGGQGRVKDQGAQGSKDRYDWTVREVKDIRWTALHSEA